jgi:hypothetical protein
VRYAVSTKMRPSGAFAHSTAQQFSHGVLVVALRVAMPLGDHEGRPPSMPTGFLISETFVLDLFWRHAVWSPHPGSPRALPEADRRRSRERRPRAGFATPCSGDPDNPPLGTMTEADASAVRRRAGIVRRRGGASRGARPTSLGAGCLARCPRRAASWHANGAAFRTSVSRRSAPSGAAPSGATVRSPHFGARTARAMRATRNERKAGSHGHRRCADDRRDGRSVAV